MLKVGIDSMRMQVTARYRAEGAVLNDTVEAAMLNAETVLELESADSPERVARVVRNAERGCFVLQALVKSVPVEPKTLLNGRVLGD
jgi:hypothetical protein